MRGFAKLARVSPDRSRADFGGNGRAGNQTIVKTQPRLSAHPPPLRHVGWQHKIALAPSKPARAANACLFRAADRCQPHAAGAIFAGFVGCSRKGRMRPTRPSPRSFCGWRRRQSSIDNDAVALGLWVPPGPRGPSYLPGVSRARRDRRSPISTHFWSHGGQARRVGPRRGRLNSRCSPGRFARYQWRHLSGKGRP